MKSAFDTGYVVSCDNIQYQKFSQVFHKSVARYDFSVLCKKLKVTRYNSFWQKCIQDFGVPEYTFVLCPSDKVALISKVESLIYHKMKSLKRKMFGLGVQMLRCEFYFRWLNTTFWILIKKKLYPATDETWHSIYLAKKHPFFKCQYI